MTRIRNAITDDNRRWWTLGAMCFALFMIMLDNTVVNVALPAIQNDLHSSISGLEWTVNAYTLSFAVLLVTGGRLGESDVTKTLKPCVAAPPAGFVTLISTACRPTCPAAGVQRTIPVTESIVMPAGGDRNS